MTAAHPDPHDRWPELKGVKLFNYPERPPPRREVVPLWPVEAPPPELEQPAEPKKPGVWRDRRKQHEHSTPDEARFGQTPETVLYDRELTDGAVRLYGVLARLTLRNGNHRRGIAADVNVGQIAADIGAGQSSIRRRLDELEARGHITRQRQRNGLLEVRVLWKGAWST